MKSEEEREKRDFRSRLGKGHHKFVLLKEWGLRMFFQKKETFPRRKRDLEKDVEKIIKPLTNGKIKIKRIKMEIRKNEWKKKRIGKRRKKENEAKADVENQEGEINKDEEGLVIKEWMNLRNEIISN